MIKVTFNKNDFKDLKKIFRKLFDKDRIPNKIEFHIERVYPGG